MMKNEPLFKYTYEVYLTLVQSITGEGNGTPFLPGESRGWRSLVGYSPWGSKESDMTEQLH